MARLSERPFHLISIALIAAALVAAIADLRAFGATAQAPSQQDQAEPDVRTLHGRALVEEACAGCHGIDGISEDPETPKLAGQKLTYLREQLQLFKNGTRAVESMTDVMAPISVTQIDELAQYYSRLPVKADRVNDRAAARNGARIFDNGFYRVPPCASCHGPEGPNGGAMTVGGMMGGGMMGGRMMGGGMGMMRIDPALIPNLSGQHAPYIVDTLNAYAGGARRDEIMSPIAASLSPAARKAVAAYLAGLR